MDSLAKIANNSKLKRTHKNEGKCYVSETVANRYTTANFYGISWKLPSANWYIPIINERNANFLSIFWLWFLFDSGLLWFLLFSLLNLSLFKNIFLSTSNTDTSMPNYRMVLFLVEHLFFSFYFCLFVVVTFVFVDL